MVKTPDQSREGDGILDDVHGEWYTLPAGAKGFPIPKGTLQNYVDGRRSWPAGVKPRLQWRKMPIPGRGRRKMVLIHKETLEAIVAARSGPASGIFHDAHGQWYTVTAGAKGFPIPQSTLKHYAKGSVPWPAGIKPRVQERKIWIPARGRRKVVLIHKETFEAIVAARSGPASGIFHDAHGEWYTVTAGAKGFPILRSTLDHYANGSRPWPAGVKRRLQWRKMPIRGRGRRKVVLIHKETLEALVAARERKRQGDVAAPGPLAPSEPGQDAAAIAAATSAAKGGRPDTLRELRKAVWENCERGSNPPAKEVLADYRVNHSDEIKSGPGGLSRGNINAIYWLRIQFRKQAGERLSKKP